MQTLTSINSIFRDFTRFLVGFRLCNLDRIFNN